VTETEFLDSLSSGIEKVPWHWYRFHADSWRAGHREPLFDALGTVAESTDKKLPGFAERLVRSLSASSGSEREIRDYEQLMQAVAEALVVSRLVLCDGWPNGTSFKLDPTAEGSKQNPELLITGPAGSIGIEVKAPGLTAHRIRRESRPVQLTYRGKVALRVDMTPPRDNPVKDFLISADAKFAAFKLKDPNFIGILVIVWDDHIYEPITALLHPLSGLLTEQSFYRDEHDIAVKFPNVTAVVLIRHLDHIARGAAGRPMRDGLAHALDFGKPGFPFKVAVPDGVVATLPKPLVNCLQLVDRPAAAGAEYEPQDIIWWLG
jgi:hypothetical protein